LSPYFFHYISKNYIVKGKGHILEISIINLYNNFNSSPYNPFLYHDMSLQEKNSILQMLKEENNGKFM